MEVFCLGGFAIWVLCVVLLAMMSAANTAPDTKAGNAQSGLQADRARSK